jgi:hypothetical protein
VSVRGPCSAGRPTVWSIGSLLAVGRSELVVVIRSSRPGRLVLRVAAVVQQEGDSSDNSLELVAKVLPCTIVGVAGHDRLIGTPGRDRMCGRAGNDIVEGRAGGDWLDGGSGNDRLTGGSGSDVLFARDGNDVVLVRDGSRDRVACGPGRDGVLADHADRVAGDCERVFRR